MQISFPNLERAKKSAKAMATVVEGIRLCGGQRAIAKLAGYRDWHDLENCQKAEPPDTLAPIPKSAERHQQIIALTHTLSADLGLPWGDALIRAFAFVPSRQPD